MSLRRHAGGYLLVGVIQWLVEYAVMVSLSAWLLPVEPANILGRVCGALLGYWLNGRFVFSGEGRALDRAAFVRFVIMWLALTGLNTAILDWIDDHHGLKVTWAGKPGVDVFTGLIGFWLSRNWVYGRPRRASGPST
ncbi:GtrA family protein [Luteimonas sp. e5]